MQRLREVFSFGDRHSWFHSMFWVIVALVVGMFVSLLAVVLGAAPALVSMLSTLWSVAVLGGAFAAAELVGDRRIVSSDRLVDWLTRSAPGEENMPKR